MKDYVKRHWLHIVLLVVLLTALTIPALAQIPVSEPPGAGGGLWEVDGTETQLITADEVDMQTMKIINVVDPGNDQDAATKKYVDDAIDTDVATHSTDTSTHGVAEIAGIADIGTHAALTATHGCAEIADVSDIAVDANLSAAAQAAIAASHTQGTDTTLGTQAENLNMGAFGITNVGNVDGIDVSAHDTATTGVHGVGTDHVALFGVASTVVSKFTTLAAANVLWRRNAIENSCFAALINSGGVGGLTATNVPYDTDSLELSLPDPTTNPQWGKVILHNITRGNSRSITDVDTTNNVITTDSSTDDWADTDVIRTSSITCVYGSPSYFFDVDISAEIPATATAVFIYISLTNLCSTTVQNQNMVLWHPYDTFAGGKLGGNRVVCGYEHNTIYSIVPVIDQKICIAFGPWGAICASGITPIFRVMGYWE